MKNNRFASFFVCAGWFATFLLCAGNALGQKQIYCTNTDAGTIVRANIDGSGSVTLISGLTVPLGLALDVTSGKIYWTENIPGSDNGKLRSANLDGTSIQDLVVRSETPDEVAVDRVHNKIWWSESKGTAPSRIARANFDGSGVEEIYQNLDGFVNNILDLFLDVEHDQMYWANRGRERLQRASLAGTNVIDLPISPPLENPRSIDIDFSSNRIYWVSDAPDGAHRGIRRAFLDGTSNQPVSLGRPDAKGLALDLDAGKVYWSESFAIRRANLDGSNPELVFNRPGEQVGGDIEIVVVPEPQSVAQLVIAIVAATIRSPRRFAFVK